MARSMSFSGNGPPPARTAFNPDRSAPASSKRRSWVETTDKWVTAGSETCFSKGNARSGKTTAAPERRQRIRIENPLTWCIGKESNHPSPGWSGINPAAPRALAMCASKECQMPRGFPLDPEVKRIVPGPSKSRLPRLSERRRASSSGRRKEIGATTQLCFKAARSRTA